MGQLAATVCATPPNDESFNSAMWWLQRGIKVLDPKVRTNRTLSENNS